MKDLDKTAVMYNKLDGIIVEFPYSREDEQERFFAAFKKTGYRYRELGYNKFRFSKESYDKVRAELRYLYTGGLMEYRDYPVKDGEKFIACAEACREAMGSDCECNCLGKFHGLTSGHNDWLRNVGRLKYGGDVVTVTRWYPQLGMVTSCGLNEKSYWWPDGRLKTQDANPPK